MDLDTMVRETLTELKEANGEEMMPPLDYQFFHHPLMSHNYAALMAESPGLMVAAMVDPTATTSIVKLLMQISFRIGIKVGRQQVMDEFTPSGINVQ